MMSSTQSQKQSRNKPPCLLLRHNILVASYIPTHSPDAISHGKCLKGTAQTGKASLPTGHNKNQSCAKVSGSANVFVSVGIFYEVAHPPDYSFFW